MLHRSILMVFLVQSLTAQANRYKFPPTNSITASGKPVPGIISKLYGDLQYGAANIHWKLYEQGSNSRFFIEKSVNGKDFTELDTVISTDGLHFQYKDPAPLPTGFYRIKAIGNDTVYSDVMRLSTLNGLPHVKVWPALFDVAINVEIESQINEAFTIVLTNSKGEILMSKEAKTEQGTCKISFDDTVSFLYAGEYSITVTGLQYSYSRQLHKK